ncbi:MAG: hypothetical protein RJQ14_24025 [Marinoscillum sp.]
MKKFLKFSVGTILFVVVLLLITRLALNRPMPEGESGQKAETLTDKMLHALNAEAYDSLKIIEWDYPRGHSFIWRKAEDSVVVMWDSYSVTFKTKTLDGGAFENDTRLKGQAHADALTKAWEFFANDSFWLVAPFKVRDPGTSRQYVKTERGEAILVTYASGGVTPGDSYLWILDEHYRPKYWQLWTQKIPIGGIEFVWHGWEEYQGVWFAPQHQGPGPVTIDITNLKVVN